MFALEITFPDTKVCKGERLTGNRPFTSNVLQRD